IARWIDISLDARAMPLSSLYMPVSTRSSDLRFPILEPRRVISSRSLARTDMFPACELTNPPRKQSLPTCSNRVKMARSFPWLFPFRTYSRFTENRWQGSGGPPTLAGRKTRILRPKTSFRETQSSHLAPELQRGNFGLFWNAVCSPSAGPIVLCQHGFQVHHSPCGRTLRHRLFQQSQGQSVIVPSEPRRQVPHLLQVPSTLAASEEVLSRQIHTCHCPNHARQYLFSKREPRELAHASGVEDGR